MEEPANQAEQSQQELQKNKPKKKKTLGGYAKYSGISFQMLGVILLGTFAGIKLDEVFATSPIFTIVLIMLGVVFAMIIVIKKL